MNWRWRKGQCKGRTEAAKLTPEQLKQLDTILSLGTGGTMELPQENHEGKLPPKSTFGDMLDLGQEAAVARNAKHVKLAKEDKLLKKQEKQQPSHTVQIPVTPEQKLELEGACTDIFKYFGMQSSTELVSADA